jgi:hypothetical protein
MPSNWVTVIDLSGLFAQKLAVMIIGSDVRMHDTRRDISEPRLCRASYKGTPANRVDSPGAADSRRTS